MNRDIKERQLHFEMRLPFLRIYTIPIATSTRSATITTNAEIINPCIIGRIPDFFRFENEVFNPIADSAHIIKNLLIVLVLETTVVGIEKTLATMDIPRKPSINQGKIFAMLKLAFNSSLFWLFVIASLRFKRS